MNDDEATRRLLHDLEHVRSPMYWWKGYIQVGCLVLVFAAVVAAAWILKMINIGI